MKKFMLVLLSVAMIFSFTACGDKDNSDKTTEETTEERVEITDSLEIFTSVWETYADEEKFAICGGDYNNSVMDSAGSFSVSDAEALDSILGVPSDAAALIDGAASMMHMMNANTFTAGAYHLSDAAKQEEFCSKVKDNIMNRQWMCGFPDTLLVVTIGDEYVVSAFGKADNMETFKNKLVAQYPTAKVVYEESLVQ